MLTHLGGVFSYLLDIWCSAGFTVLYFQNPSPKVTLFYKEMVMALLPCLLEFGFV